MSEAPHAHGSPSDPAEAEPLLVVRELTLLRGGERAVLDRVSLTAHAGETVVLLGEAGCGKGPLLRLIAGEGERGERIGGQIRLAGQELPLGRRRRTPPRGVVYLPGPHAAPLSPHVSAAEQLTHVLARRLGIPRASARAELELALLRLDRRLRLASLAALPGQLAPDILCFGLMALTFAQTPTLILADQPFAGIAPLPLQMLASALRTERARLGSALLYAALGTEAAPVLGGRALVLRHGRIVEESTLERLSGPSAHSYTRTLFRDWSEPAPPSRGAGRGEPVLQVLGLSLPGGPEALNFELRRGAALAFVGEPGSGRHRLLEAVAGLSRPNRGRVLFGAVNTSILASQMLMRLRRRIAYVVGDDDALDPRMTVAHTVSEPLRAHLRLPRDTVAGYRDAALKRVGLASVPGATQVGDLSRFDKRRLQVARAIVTAPLLTVVDEPFKGLDAFAQSVMRDLLRTFRVEEGPALIVVTADFAVARALAESAFVFSNGGVVERGPIAEMLRAPKAPATRSLVAAAEAARRLAADPQS